MMDGTGVELRPFGRFTGETGKIEMVSDTPAGRRYIVGVRAARFTGDRFRAAQRGDSAADWMLVTADDVAHIDVRLTVRTEDEALVYVSYRGRADWSQGHQRAHALCLFTFETGAAEYAWLNSAFIVGHGRPGTAGPDYELCELRPVGTGKLS
jgi:Protein of unknown function (DUF3237)